MIFTYFRTGNPKGHPIKWRCYGMTYQPEMWSPTTYGIDRANEIKLKPILSKTGQPGKTVRVNKIMIIEYHYTKNKTQQDFRKMPRFRDHTGTANLNSMVSIKNPKLSYVSNVHNGNSKDVIVLTYIEYKATCKFKFHVWLVSEIRNCYLLAAYLTLVIMTLSC